MKNFGDVLCFALLSFGFTYFTAWFTISLLQAGFEQLGIGFMLFASFVISLCFVCYGAIKKAVIDFLTIKNIKMLRTIAVTKVVVGSVSVVGFITYIINSL